MNFALTKLKLLDFLLDNDKFLLNKIRSSKLSCFFPPTFLVQLLVFDLHRILDHDNFLLSSQLYLGVRKYGSTWALFPPVWG